MLLVAFKRQSMKIGKPDGILFWENTLKNIVTHKFDQDVIQFERERAFPKNNAF